jgi:prepilin-type N-terminal cleavage/methylation domain-containing protein
MNNARGFTFIEVLLVMGLAAIILAFTNVAVVRLQTQADIDAEVQKIISDIKSQQLKSMIGETIGTGDPISYGLKFATTSYTLFRGSSFSPSDPVNFTIDFPSSIQVSTTSLINGEIIFQRLSGEVAGFSAGRDSVTLENVISGATSTVRINRHGAVIKTP